MTTGLGYPKKADDAAANPKVALLFSDPTGSGLHDPPMVLVQGTARVDDDDLDANRERYQREALEKLPGTKDALPPEVHPGLVQLVLHAPLHQGPARARLRLAGGDWAAEPELLDSHMEEVRSGHDEEPDVDRRRAARPSRSGTTRMDTLGQRLRHGGAVARRRPTASRSRCACR